MMVCTLCEGKETIQRKDVPEFYHCEDCGLVFKDSRFLISSKEEKERYLTHNNDIHDLGYQKFVAPIVNAVKVAFPPTSLGLDFGAGTGPVIASLLEKSDYNITLYDPFFHPDSKVLESTYDYVVCCEVMEHFYFPVKEFQLLGTLIKPDGKLFCMTQLMKEDTSFKTWPYRNDKTHVSFYKERTLNYIKSQFGFNEVKVADRLIIFSK